VPSSGESSSRHVATNPFDARTPSGLGTCMYVRRHTRQTRPAVNDAPPRRSRALLSDRMGRHRAGRGHRTAAGRPFLSAAYTLPQATGGAGVPPPSEFASAAEQWPDAGLRLKFQGALLKLAPPGPARRRLMESPAAACFAVVAKHTDRDSRRRRWSRFAATADCAEHNRQEYRMSLTVSHVSNAPKNPRIEC